MKDILHIHADTIHTFDDVYDLIDAVTPIAPRLYSRNLDALFDVLSDLWLKKVIFHEKRKLKTHLEWNYDESKNEMSDYYKLLDIFVDLPGVDIELLD